MNRLKLTIIIFAILLFLWIFVGFAIYMNVKITNWNRLNEIEEVDPASYRIFHRFIDEIEEETSWNVVIISGLRSKEKQKELLRENAKNAAVEKSRHVMGRAIDINLYKKNWLWRIWLKKFNSKKDWRNTGVVKISEKYGLLWGGSYHSYHDPVHFEIR